MELESGRSSREGKDVQCSPTELPFGPVRQTQYRSQVNAQGGSADSIKLEQGNEGTDCSRSKRALKPSKINLFNYHRVAASHLDRTFKLNFRLFPPP